MTQYTFTQLENLWVQAGGNPQNKAMAAAIAMAESGGNSQSTNNNGNGSIDRGLWQINSVHGSLSTYDPVANARAAVQISNGGSNWRPWCTAYSDALCGTKGGTYLGSNSPFMKFLNGQSTGPLSSGNSGNISTPVQQVGAVQGVAWYDWLIPFGTVLDPSLAAGGGGSIPLGGISNTIESGIAGAISDILAPVGRAILHTLFVVGGALTIAYGIYVMITGSPGGFSPTAQANDAKDAVNETQDQVNETNTQSQPTKPVSKNDSVFQSTQEGRRSRRAPSPSSRSSESGPGRHRGQQAREGRTAKAASKAAEGAEVAAA